MQKTIHKRGRAGKIALLGILTALAFALSWLEFFIPFSFTVPGIKLGLANAVTVVAVYRLRARDALALSLVRIILAGFAFSGLFATFYALSGALLSLSVMLLLKKTGRFTPLGVSVSGGVSHNLGQIVFACFAFGTDKLLHYIPLLLISGTVSGALVGALAAVTLKRTQKQSAGKDNL